MSERDRKDRGNFGNDVWRKPTSPDGAKTVVLLVSKVIFVVIIAILIGNETRRNDRGTSGKIVHFVKPVTFR